MVKWRTRSRQTQTTGGSIRWFGVATAQKYTIHWQDINDAYEKGVELSTGLLPTTYAKIRKRRITGVCSLGGTSWNGDAVYSGYLLTPNFNAGIIPANHDRKAKTWEVYVNQLLAETNPFRYVYSIPVGIKDLIELATLFKFAAKTFAGFAGGAYLNYRFGWASFHRDLEAIYSITKAVEKRMLEFKSLSLHGGLRRRMKLDSYTSSESLHSPNGWVLHSSYGAWVEAKSRHISATTRVYGTVRWYPNGIEGWSFLHNMTPLQTFNTSLRSVLDLQSVSAQTIWELVPFSWLIDYFFEVSPYLGANRNSGLVTPKHICLVFKTTAQEKLSSITSTPPTLSASGSVSQELLQYERQVMSRSAFPTSLPLLSASEAKAIVALLAKFKG